MKKNIKFIYAVVIFTFSLILTNTKANAKKQNEEFMCDKYDNYCGTTSSGNSLIGNYIPVNQD